MKALISELLIRNLQKKYFKEMPANSFERTAASMDMVLESGVRFRSEIQYSGKYPNSFFDINYGAEENTTSLPTYINLHGGGFFMGSRATGDPLANAKAIGGTMMPDIAKNSFNVVVADYCLAPKYRYPAQLHQVNELLLFLKEHGSEYGLNGENIILMGDSAGAVFTAMYGVVISNPAYAKQLGITPSVTQKEVRGLIIDGAPTITEVMNWQTAAMYRVWTGTRNMKNSKPVKEIRVSHWINQNYPPSFFTAGNEGCWPEDATENYEAAKRAGAETYLYIPDIAKGKEGHGYLNGYQTDPLAKEGVDRLIAFAKEKTGQK